MEYINNKLEEFKRYIKAKNVAIIGLGVSNIPLINYLYNLGAIITVFDQKTEAELNEEALENVKAKGFNIITGKECLKEVQGFDIIFRSPSALPTIPELVEEVERGAILTSEIEMLLKLAPCKVIGVTGTEGKTTTTSIIADIIKKAGYNCYLGGNIGKPIFVEIDNIKPEDVIVIELSSFQLMDMDVSPEISIVTNIYTDHLNVHKSYEEYQDAKKNIFKYQTENGLLILNKDNDITYSFSKEANGKVILFSSKEKLENGYIYDRDDETIKFCKDGIRRHILKRTDIKLRGIHNYENICAALAATAPLVSIEKQTEAIKSFNGVEHRLEFVRELDGVKYYNDSIGTSPASTIAGLNAFDENIILLAGGSDKGLDYKEVGENIARKVGILILTGPTAEKIEDATLKAKNGENVKIYHCENLKEAVELSKNVSTPGDVVLLSPASASFDAFKNFVERGIKFKELVNNLK